MGRYRAVLFDWRGTLVHIRRPDWHVTRALESIGRAAESETVDSVIERVQATSDLPEFIEAERLIDLSAAFHRATTMRMYDEAGLDSELAEALVGYENPITSYHDADGAVCNNPAPCSSLSCISSYAASSACSGRPSARGLRRSLRSLSCVTNWAFSAGRSSALSGTVALGVQASRQADSLHENPACALTLARYRVQLSPGSASILTSSPWRSGGTYGSVSPTEMWKSS